MKELPKERERTQTKLGLEAEVEQAVEKDRGENLHGLFPAARRHVGSSRR